MRARWRVRHSLNRLGARSRSGPPRKPRPSISRRTSAPERSSKLRAAVTEALSDASESDLPRISPTQAVRELRDGVPATALRQIQAHLERICSTAIVVAHALRVQNVQVDDDATCVLRWHVRDPLFEQIARLKRIIAGGGAVKKLEDKDILEIAAH